MKIHALLVAPLLLTLAAALTLPIPAHAMGANYGKGDPKRPSGNSSWPSGISSLANQTNRIGGYWLNSMDTFYYAGDVKAFNDFLREYANTRGAHTLMLQTRTQIFLFPPAHLDGYDWQMTCSQGMVTVPIPATSSHQLHDVELPRGQGTVTISIPINGRIRLQDIVVPGSMFVSYDSSLEGKPLNEEETADIKAFLAQHPAPPIRFSR